MKAVIIFIDNTHAPIGRWYFQNLQQMPLGTAEVVGFPVKDDTVGNKVKVVIPATDTLVSCLQ